MESRSIGSLSVSLVGLGCNNFGMRIDLDRTQAVVDAALDAGITLFDTADVYGGTKSEEFLGQALG
ncbi:MAG TPA: aldo/keto reductase, partial [Acidimicrobiales bacterium]|nr:aldo/keto reductase [Acidimicrobiales bacterium]